MRQSAATALVSLLLAAGGVGAQVVTFPTFRAQEVDKSLKVGYAVKLLDLNGDKKPDILVIDSARVIWFENPGRAGKDTPWKLHTIVDNAKAGIKTDNVCAAVYDIDGDGKLDIALGADWPANTKTGGSLQWLRQGADIDDPWTVHKIWDSEPTLHRIYFADLDGGGRPQLVVAPLRGRDSTAANNFLETGVRLLAFKIPADPTKDKWEPTVLTDKLHTLHNVLPVEWDKDHKGEQLLTASYEGVNLVTGSAGKWTLTRLGAGAQADPKAYGAGEIKLGHTKGGGRLLATVEPFHGNMGVVYTPPAAGQDLWTRTVLDDSYKEGHGIAAADFDGDGADEIVAGWRGSPPGLRIYKSAPGTSGAAPAWQKHDLDMGGVAVEDLACADLDGDDKPDIVAVGRATHNVKIYWNTTGGK